METLKRSAKSKGLWNLFLSKAHYPDVGVDLTNLEVSRSVFSVLRRVMEAALMVVVRV